MTPQVALAAGVTATMRCSTAGLTAGNTVTIVDVIGGELCNVEDLDGQMHTVIAGDLTDLEAPE